MQYVTIKMSPRAVLSSEGSTEGQISFQTPGNLNSNCGQDSVNHSLLVISFALFFNM